MIKPKIVYFDMDNVLVDFTSAISEIDDGTLSKYNGSFDNITGIFSKMKPNTEMVELFNKLELDNRFDCYILSTAPWGNPSAWSDKLEWVKKYIPLAFKKLILSHNKNLNVGDFLIDDRLANGADRFMGNLILYRHPDTIFKTADDVESYINWISTY